MNLHSGEEPRLRLSSYDSSSALYHLQAHGNVSCSQDVFLSDGVTSPPAVLTTVKTNIVAASVAAAGGGATLAVDVYDNAAHSRLRGTINPQMRYAAGVKRSMVWTTTGSNASRFFHIELRRIGRRAAGDPLASAGRNPAVVIPGIAATAF